MVATAVEGVLAHQNQQEKLLAQARALTGTDQTTSWAPVRQYCASACSLQPDPHWLCPCCVGYTVIPTGQRRVQHGEHGGQPHCGCNERRHPGHHCAAHAGARDRQGRPDTRGCVNSVQDRAAPGTAWSHACTTRYQTPLSTTSCAHLWAPIPGPAAGKTALLVAVQGGHTAAAAALLKCGVDVWRGDIRGNTALHIACWQVRASQARVLEQSGEMPCNATQRQAMMRLCALLRDSQTLPAPRRLHQQSTRICSQGDLAIVKLLLSHADAVEPDDLPDARRLVNAVNLAGLTPIHFAAWRGRTSVLRALVNSGAALTAGASADSMGDVSCNKGSTPLHLAAMKVRGSAVDAMNAMQVATMVGNHPHTTCGFVSMLGMPNTAPLGARASVAPANPIQHQGDVAVISLLLRAHARLVELSTPAEHRYLRDPRRIPDGYGKTAYVVAFDLGRCGGPAAARWLGKTGAALCARGIAGLDVLHRCSQVPLPHARRSDAAAALDPTVGLHEAVACVSGNGRAAAEPPQQDSGWAAGSWAAEACTTPSSHKAAAAAMAAAVPRDQAADAGKEILLKAVRAAGDESATPASAPPVHTAPAQPTATASTPVLPPPPRKTAPVPVAAYGHLLLANKCP